MKIQNEESVKVIVEKQIIIQHNYHVLCCALNVKLKPLSFELILLKFRLDNIEQIINLLMLFDEKNIYIGGSYAINFSGIHYSLQL